MNKIRKLIFDLKYRVGEENLCSLATMLVIVMVGVSSFGIGRISVKNTIKEPISIKYTIQGGDSVKTVKNGVLDTEGAVVASKNGTKYHYPWCPGAKQISDKNLISFASIAIAQESGYTKALNCKGL